mgnify:CR=1 FL=1
MKKVFSLILLLVFFAGCAESVALLGTATTGSNIAQSTVSSAMSYGIKKQTGKSPMEHVVAYAEKHNPDRKKVKCVNFLELTETEVCSILKKRVSELRSQINKNSKIKILD